MSTIASAKRLAILAAIVIGYWAVMIGAFVCAMYWPRTSVILLVAVGFYLAAAILGRKDKVILFLSVACTFLTLIALPKFALIEAKMCESRILGDLALLRANLQAYKKEKGNFPQALEELVPFSKSKILTINGTSMKLTLEKFPTLDLHHAHHPVSGDVVSARLPLPGPAGSIDAAALSPEFLSDSGTWAYDRASGAVIVNCSHNTIQKGRPWNIF